MIWVVVLFLQVEIVWKVINTEHIWEQETSEREREYPLKQNRNANIIIRLENLKKNYK